MAGSFAREIGLLRTIVKHLEQRPLPGEEITQAFLRREGLGHIHQKRGGILAIRTPGHRAFADLAECVADRLPAMARGTVYAHVQTELFTVIEPFVGRTPESIGATDADALVRHFEAWFAQQSHACRVFIPCVITPRRADAFDIGPVRFVFIDDVLTSDLYPGPPSDALNRTGMDNLLKWMREGHGDWLARVTVLGCERTRAEEVGELSADLAIVALQLIAPYLDTRSMCRLDARRGTSQKRTLLETDGHYAMGWTRREPGITIGTGTLADILQKGAKVVTAIGNIVGGFAGGVYRLPLLEQAWCDAAYWFHQALAESIDTIAVTQLETALEVLFAAGSAQGSTSRILDILHAFFGIGPDDPIYGGSMMTARKFAANLVRDRSRILHGTWSTLNARGMDREGLEGFVTSVLRMAVVELDDYARQHGSADSISAFLTWLVAKKP